MTPVSQLGRAQPLQGVRALRAVAALAVVAYHAGEMLHGSAALSHGAAGVDVFFVISGFVMVVSSQRLIGRPDAALAFLRARLRRIVPLYWLCSAAKLGLVLAVPALRPGLPRDVAYVAGSFLFLPVHTAAGAFMPVLPVGWTLSFEMLFYGLFAAALAARLSPVMLVPPVLLALTLLPKTAWAIGELTNPVVLEFAFGTTLAAIWLRGYRLPAACAWPLAAMAAAALCVLPSGLGMRHLGWGLPAACLVAAVVSLEGTFAARLPRVVLLLGDASFAIYLTHGFVRSAIVPLLPHLPGWASLPPVFVPLVIVTSAAFGWVVHDRLERRWLGGGVVPPPVYARSNPPIGLACTLPGNTFSSPPASMPRCAPKIPFATLRKSVVGARSRFSNSAACASPGQTPPTRPPATLPPSTKATPAVP
jgi:peptidoglycan/LPS O-acetylase OafA/YrhL